MESETKLKALDDPVTKPFRHKDGFFNNNAKDLTGVSFPDIRIEKSPLYIITVLKLPAQLHLSPSPWSPTSCDNQMERYQECGRALVGYSSSGISSLRVPGLRCSMICSPREPAWGNPHQELDSPEVWAAGAGPGWSEAATVGRGSWGLELWGARVAAVRGEKS